MVPVLATYAEGNPYPNANQDLLARPVPPLPTSGPGAAGFGPAGTVFIDPTYGTKIVRMTDSATITAPYWNTYSCSYCNTWAADDTAFLLVDGNGTKTLFAFDPGALTATRLHPVDNAALFSLSQPHVIWQFDWSTGTPVLSQWDYMTRVTTGVLDTGKLVPNWWTQPGAYSGQLSASYDDSVVAAAFGGVQNTHPYVAASVHGTAHLLNIRNWTVDGQTITSTPKPLNMDGTAPGVHSIELDASGRYVEMILNYNVVDCGMGYTQCPYYFWDLQSGSVVHMNVAISGHSAMGWGYRVNQSPGPSGLYNDGRDFSRRLLSDVNGTSVQCIICANAGDYNDDSHISWVLSTAQTPLAPFVGSLYDQNGNPNGHVRYAWQDEIIAGATDGSGTVWRFAFHHALYTGAFESTPRGNLSPDGRFYLFNSNWENTLGGRVDVFLAQLKVDTTQAAPLTTSSQPTTAVSPSSSDIQSGPVRPIFINAGGPAYTDSQGNGWASDPGFIGSGGIYSAGRVNIANTTTPALYQDESYGDVDYQFTVPNGTYAVTLKFAELTLSSAGQRLFNVYVNGQLALQNFDIVAAAGGPRTAVDRQIPVNVTNGVVQVQLRGVQYGATISAIQIAPGSASPSSGTSTAGIYINAGGGAYTDSQGTAWGADPGFSGTGGLYSAGQVAIAKTATPELYQDETWGDVNYAFPVSNGSHTVTLKFAELTLSSAGQRTFNVYINGQLVLQNFDIIAAAGAPRTAVDKQIPVNVTNGTLQIQLRGVQYGATISAIEIH